MTPTGELLRAVAVTTNRNEMADEYEYWIGDPYVEWPKVNAAIVDRWSKSGLTYIKNRAWKIRTGRVVS